MWVRALVGPAGNESAALLSLQAVVGPQPPGWLKQTWTYTQCTFASALITAGRLASLLESGLARIPGILGVVSNLQVPAISEQFRKIMSTE